MTLPAWPIADAAVGFFAGFLLLDLLQYAVHRCQHAVPFLVQVWLFATPIAYPSSMLAEPWRTLYGLNPMVGVVEGFRWALLGTSTAPGPIILVSSLAARGRRPVANLKATP